MQLDLNAAHVVTLQILKLYSPFKLQQNPCPFKMFFVF